jgi:hypothetical protein
MLLKKGSNKLSLENGFLLLAAGLGVAVLGSFAAVALPGIVMAVVIVASVSIFLGSVILPFTVRHCPKLSVEPETWPTVRM